MFDNLDPNTKNKIKKSLLGLFLVLYVMIFVGGFVFLPKQPAQAATLPVLLVESAVDKTNKILEQIKQGIVKGLVVGFMRTVTYFMERVAHDVAVYAASGGKGQGAMVFSKGFEGYMTDVADNMVGTFLDELSSATGLPICQPPDLSIDLSIRLGISKMDTDKPDCSLSKLRQNWSKEALSSKYGGMGVSSRAELMKKMQQSLSADETDLDYAMKLPILLGEKQQQALAAAENDRKEGEGYKAAQQIISGKVTSPASAVKDDLKSENLAAKKKTVEQQAGDSLKEGFIDLLPYTAVTFLNTFLSTVLQNFTSGGTLFGVCVTGDCGGTAKDDFVADYESGGSATYGRAEIDVAVTKALTVKPTTPKEYDIMTQLFSCPADNPGTFNCAADKGLFDAVQQADLGDSAVPLTIREAMGENGGVEYMHGSWPLIPDTRTADNQSSELCQSQAYCAGNIRVLRMAGVLPLGFEIAASLVGPTERVTLKEVVNNFENQSSRFYHLIDPNWVLKAPITKCGAEVYANTMLSSGPNRLKECVDIQQCVGTLSNKQCFAWGYCTRTKNVWRFSGVDTCEPQNRTCKLFTNTKTGETNSYLYRTVDTGECSADNSGCTKYSLSKSDDNKWVEDGIGSFWKRDSADNKSWNFSPKTISFNQNLNTSCSADSAGCSAFQWAENPTQEFALKKAPDYLKCYDANSSVGGIQYPTSPSDLSQIDEYLSLEANAWRKKECAQYAQPCIEEEVNCNWYAQAGGLGISVPGKFKPAVTAEISGVNTVTQWNDQCDGQCVGYDAYKEMTSNYSSGQDRVYILPSSGSDCAAEDAGCTGFTNLETTKGGVANTEYYSYLRPCIKPDAQRQKTFYTYEGADASGFQLKTYTLQVDGGNSSDPDGQTGGPAYFYRTVADRDKLKSDCNANNYKSGTSTPDCRQFNDENGKIYYRVLANTVAVSDKCTSYRLNETDMETLSVSDCAAEGGSMLNGACKKCFNNGELRDGYCVYQGLPSGVQNTAGISHTCAQSSDSCRAYKGSTGNSYNTALDYNFDPDKDSAVQLGEWSANNIRISGESTRSGGGSLVLSSSGSGTTLSSKSFAIETSKVYILSFWGKGQSYHDSQPFVTINARLGGTAAPSSTLGTEWRYYQIKIMPSGSTGSLIVTVENSGNSFVYLDNLKLVAVNDMYYKVKNSLSVPSICDSNIYDNLPGEALGCQAYKNTAGTEFYLTNFERLCREAAVGCAALVDNHNSADAGSQMFNYWISGVGGTTASKVVGGVMASCSVPNGKNGCYVNVAGANFDNSTNILSGVRTSTVYIPSDNPTSSPVYLVVNQTATCNVTDLGCVKAGLQTMAPSGMTYQDVVIKNNPDQYSSILCTADAVGCRTFRAGNGNYYFKDPAAIGQKICTYRTDVKDASGTSIRGWFWKNVGVCSNNADVFCTANTDCGAGATCDKMGEQPCYPDYRRFDYYGLFSYGTTGDYKNFVGECPKTEDGCTKYVDHNDTSTASGMDRAYYFLDNDALNSHAKDCDSGASLKTGCILMDKTDNPAKIYDTAATYAASEQKESLPERPWKTANNDANMVLKATRDRVCGEWLSCGTVTNYIDEDTGAELSKCTTLQVCSKAQPEVNPSQCARTPSEVTPKQGGILDINTYVNRNTKWSGMDFTGYSVYNEVQIKDLRPIKNPYTGIYYLMAYNTSTPALKTGSQCADGRGIVLSGICYMPPDGGKVNAGWDGFKEQLDCRGYPEESSPLPPTACTKNSFVALPGTTGVSVCNQNKYSFADANICAMSVSDADLTDYKGCSYRKVDYGTNKNIYYCDTNNGSQGSVAYSYCDGGTGDSQAACEGSGGTWAVKKSVTLVKGWQGYCAQRDIRYRVDGRENNSADADRYKCLMWYPLDMVNGASDPFNTNEHSSLINSVFDGEAWMCMYNEPLQGDANNKYGWESSILTKPNNFDLVSGESDSCVQSPDQPVCVSTSTVVDTDLPADDDLRQDDPPLACAQAKADGTPATDCFVETLDNSSRPTMVRYLWTEGGLSILGKPSNALVWNGLKNNRINEKCNAGSCFKWTNILEADDCKNDGYKDVPRSTQRLNEGRFVLQGNYFNSKSMNCTVCCGNDASYEKRWFRLATNYHQFNNSIYNNQFSKQGFTGSQRVVNKKDIQKIEVYLDMYEGAVPGTNGALSQVVVFDGDLMNNLAVGIKPSSVNPHFLYYANNGNKDWVWGLSSGGGSDTWSLSDLTSNLFEGLSTEYIKNMGDGGEAQGTKFEVNKLDIEKTSLARTKWSDKGGGDRFGLVVRAHFNKNTDNFEGMGMAGLIDATYKKPINYFFVIYLRPGYCKQWAQVSSAKNGIDFPSKPVASALMGNGGNTLFGNWDSYINGGYNRSYYNMMNRERAVGFSVEKFGLMASGLASNTISYVTPGLVPNSSEYYVGGLVDPCASFSTSKQCNAAPADDECTWEEAMMFGNGRCFSRISKPRDQYFKHWQKLSEMESSDITLSVDRLFSYANYTSSVAGLAQPALPVPNIDKFKAGLPVLYNIVKNNTVDLFASSRSELFGMFAQVYAYKYTDDGVTVKDKAVGSGDRRAISTSEGGHAPVILPAWCSPDPSQGCKYGYNQEFPRPLVDTTCSSTLRNKNNFTVNGYIGNRVFTGGYAPITVRFFAYAHPEHMPIRRIMVDANQAPLEQAGLSDSLDNYGNFLPKCGDEFKNLSCDRVFSSGGSVTAGSSAYGDYGTTLSTGCEARPYSLSFTYVCDPVDPMDINSVPATERIGEGDVVGRQSDNSVKKYITLKDIRTQQDKYGSLYDNISNGSNTNDNGVVCLFRPRVQVMDNWGWIGTQNGSAYKSVNCDNDKRVSDKCQTSPNVPGSQQNWVNYNGYIVVVPRNSDITSTGVASGATTGDDLYDMSQEEMD